MSELTTTKSRLFENRHQWGSIVRDLMLMRLPQAGEVISLQDILDYYKISRAEMSLLLKEPTFRKMLEVEKQKVTDLGNRAGQVYRAEEMATRLGEKLCVLALNDAMQAKDMISLYKVYLTSAGIDAPADRKEASQTVAVQINIPEGIPHLQHLEAYRVKEVIDVQPITPAFCIQADSDGDKTA